MSHIKSDYRTLNVQDVSSSCSFGAFTLADLRKAIEDRRVIKLDYPPGVRLIEPHTLGLSNDRNLLLRAYQIEGASASGEHKHWKLFRLDRVLAMSVTNSRFDWPRDGYKRNDSAMRGGIIAEL